MHKTKSAKLHIVQDDIATSFRLKSAHILRLIVQETQNIINVIRKKYAIIPTCIDPYVSFL